MGGNKMMFYLAAPFFNAEQLAAVEKIKEIAKKYDLKFYSPKDECIIQPNADSKTRKKVFNDNLRAIKKADFVVCVSDGKDLGTLFEAGYSYAKKKPIIYIALTLGDRPFNLMLCSSATAVFQSWEKFEEYMADTAAVGIKAQEYTGVVI
jgi:nucleoside 2-deoxyribosyltransferase